MEAGNRAAVPASMISVFVQRNGETQHTDQVDPAWLDPAARAVLWVDIAGIDAETGKLLANVFHLHPLSVEDALSVTQYPKIEPYSGYLYTVLHGIDFKAARHQFATRDIDFFLGPNYLVTVHDGESRSIAKLRDVCEKHAHVLEEGPVALMHRIVDQMVDNYGPTMEQLEKQIDRLEEEAYYGRHNLVRRVLRLKRDLASMRRILIPQRDAVGRLARREFPAITDEMSYRFRDVYDHVVRLTEEAMLFQDRVTGVLEVNLATVSNRLNQIMKVLTVLSTIFMPLTLISGMWGMNVRLPMLPGGEGAQFWWVSGFMCLLTGGMLGLFRWMDWI
jgi:magnesium transporter